MSTNLFLQSMTFVGFLVFPFLSFGQTWTETAAPAAFWTSVAISSDGTKIVAGVGEVGGPVGSIYISTDSGVNWIQTSAPSNRWSRVASSADGTRLAAAAGLGPLLTSTNGGMTWISNSVPTLSWKSVASSSDGSKLFAEALPAQLYVSTNSGGVWTSNIAPGGTWVIACSPDATKLIAAGGNSPPRLICTSTNSGLTWITNSTQTSSIGAVALSADGKKLFAADRSGSADGLIYRSSDAGATWETNSPAGVWQSIACSADGTKLIAASHLASGYPFGPLYTSTDSGVTWISNNLPIQSWRSVACSADGNAFVAVAAHNGTNANGEGRIWIGRFPPESRLEIEPLTNNVVLSWTIPSTNFVLQQNFDLNTGNWTDLTNIPVLNLTNLRNEISLQRFNTNSFYRLRSP